MTQVSLKEICHNRRLQWIAVALVIAPMLIFLFQTDRRANRADGYDFTSYLISAEALLDGENPYRTETPFPYVYPLFLAFILIPLTAVPYWLANAVWFSLNVGCLIGTIYLILLIGRERFAAPAVRLGIIPAALVILLLSGVIQNNFLNGQVNFIVFFLMTLFLRLHLTDRFLPATVALATAIAIKLVPLIFLLFLVLRKRFKDAALTIAGAAILCLLPFLLLGSDIFNVYADYADTFLFGSLAGNEVAGSDRMFFTLSGFVSYLVPSAGFWPPLKLVSTGLVIGLVGVFDLFSIKNRSATGQLGAFNLYLVTILLITPLSETHHLAYLIPCVLLLMFRFWSGQTERHIISGFALGLFFLLFFLGSIVQSGLYHFLAVLTLFSSAALLSSRRVR